MRFDFKKVLILAPHTDDGEFGCGGTIAKWVEDGVEVFYVAFSACELSMPLDLPKDTLVTEVKAATKILGIPEDHLILKKYGVRTFNFHRQEILQDMIELRETIAPDIVFMPSLQDIHQDHHTVAQEGLRAFKFCTIMCYEMPWNNLNFNTTVFNHLSEEHIQKKILAMQQYKSQQGRPYSNEEFIRALARTRGVQVSTHYAETFEVLRINIP